MRSFGERNLGKDKPTLGGGGGGGSGIIKKVRDKKEK